MNAPLGMYLRESREVVTDPTAHRNHPELHAAGEFEHPARLALGLLHGPFSIFYRSQDADGALKKLAPDLGQ